MPGKGSQGAPLSHHTDGSFSDPGPQNRTPAIPNQVPFKDVGDMSGRAHDYAQGGAVSGGQGYDRSK